MPLTTDWIQAGAAIVTMLAAVIALGVAWKAPRLAAEWAERFRAQSEAANERDKLRMLIFTSLMKCRAQILHSDAIAALNLIDIAFVDSSEVRGSYRHFLDAANREPANPTAIVERFHSIIEKVARELGMSDRITVADVKAGYYPAALGKLDSAALADAEEKIARAALAKGYVPLR